MKMLPNIDTIWSLVDEEEELPQEQLQLQLQLPRWAIAVPFGSR
ncbi:MAG: hypothetical protein ACK4RV_13645 [Caulobacter sp.]